jgi:hypothetical protein
MPWLNELIGSATLKDTITIGAASVGAVLGIMNTWNSMNQRRVRLRVIPAFVMTSDHDPLGFSVEVVNLSMFPITVAEIGFEVGHGQRAPLQSPQFLDNKSLPRRIESREAISALFGPRDFQISSNVRLGYAYVRTACGRTIYGNSPAGRQFSKMLTEIAEGR